MLKRRKYSIPTHGGASSNIEQGMSIFDLGNPRYKNVEASKIFNPDAWKASSNIEQGTPICDLRNPRYKNVEALKG
jgi:hypothetical protein